MIHTSKIQCKSCLIRISCVISRLEKKKKDMLKNFVTDPTFVTNNISFTSVVSWTISSTSHWHGVHLRVSVDNRTNVIFAWCIRSEQWSDIQWRTSDSSANWWSPVPSTSSWRKYFNVSFNEFFNQCWVTHWVINIVQILMSLIKVSTCFSKQQPWEINWP